VSAADELLAAARDPGKAAGDGHAAPSVSLPLRVLPARASALGWSPDLFALTVLLGNASFRQEDGALVPRGPGPVVAVCAEYDRPLVSLAPPALAAYSLVRARLSGMPTVRLPGGWLRPPLRLESTHRAVRTSDRREEAVVRATRFLEELNQAWHRRLGAILEIAWPVYFPEVDGPLLDAASGAPLPELVFR
jgi:hypothetical protein